ncbi:hypothetical protein ACHAXR_000567, partial [Thalassiosira sp. AJA248-18]
IIGMSGIFTCVPKESPGYEYRETLDFGKIYTTKRTWIRVPKSGVGASFKTISAVLGGADDGGGGSTIDGGDENTVDEKSVDEKSAAAAPDANNDNNDNNSNAPPPPTSSSKGKKNMKHLYSFREIEVFGEGHAIIHSMAREYMGTDYDLLRKNCCTFAREVCIRLGVQDHDIPSWFHNAAQAGANAEDMVTSVEYSVRNLLDCDNGDGQGRLDPLDLECYNHGFEVIPDNSLDGDDLFEDKEEKTGGYLGSTRLKVVESPSMRTPRERKPLIDEFDMHETASWTY